MSDFNYKITERIAVLSQNASGEKMLKGITLSDEEAAELKAAMHRMGEDSYGERGV